MPQHNNNFAIRPDNYDNRVTAPPTGNATGKDLADAALRAAQLAQQPIVAPLDDTETGQLLQLLAKLAQGNKSLSRAPEKTQRQGPNPTDS